MAEDNTLQFTDENFEQEVEQAEQPVLVDFGAEWCGGCKTLGPVIDGLANHYKGKAKIGKIDTDANRKASLRFQISSIPTVILFHKGEIIEKFVGLRSQKEFQTAIDKLIA